MLSKNGLPSHQEAHIESPFLEEEFFEQGSEQGWEPRHCTLVSRSPFEHAFERGIATPAAASEPEADLVQRVAAADFAMEEAEAYGEAGPEDGLKEEAYYEDEAIAVEGETDEVAALTRMKFEFQSFDPDKGQGNRIWRNDGKSASPLNRKYGPRDFLVDRKKVRLESETNAVLEFETEWFRTWPKLEEALDEAVKMTDAMNGAASSRLAKSRKAFPFDVAHLRTGSAAERARRYWNPDNYLGYENRHWNEDKKEYQLERILGAEEELEIELVDSRWKAGIQSSEAFLLEYYESFLRQHEWPRYIDGAIRHATAILAAANTDGIPVAQLGKLQSLLQIIVNYVMRGQGGKASEDAGAFTDVKGLPSKQAFTLLSRTNFASMYKVLLTERERRLFQRIVRDDVALKVMGLDRKSPVFVNGYGQRPEPGPTVYKWLSGIPAGVDLLSVRSGKGLSAAMGRYNVETRKGKKDRWMVKFEARNTTLGATGIEVKDWAKYAAQLFNKASGRERDALALLLQRGLADENQLTNFVFHARNPDLGGRRIRKGEQTLAQQWLRLRSEVVRPALPAAQPEFREAHALDGTMSSDIDARMHAQEGGDEPEGSASDPEYELAVAVVEEDSEASERYEEAHFDHETPRLARAVTARLVASPPGSCAQRRTVNEGQALKEPFPRPCCAFHPNLDLVGDQVKDVGDAAPHFYGEDKYPNPEKSGFIYTCRGGFVDLGHARDWLDWTGYFAVHAKALLPAGGTLELTCEPRASTRTVKFKAQGEKRSDEICVYLAQRIAYQLAVWHEIVTALLGDKYSAFSPEDNYSNLLGTYMGRDALLTFRRKPFNEAAAVAVRSWLLKLGAVSPSQTISAFDKVKGDWWKDVGATTLNDLLLKRHFDALGPVQPWLVSGVCAAASPFSLPVPNIVETPIRPGEKVKTDLKKLYVLELGTGPSVGAKLAGTKWDGRAYLTPDEFAELIQHARTLLP